jgi:two-component system CheB/CheR fusion protein
MDEVENVASSTGDLVVVGSSAGGIEALSVLVNTLPANFPAPLVLAQHLDTSRPSNLDSILQRHTVLPVEVVTSRSKLEAGKIYVVPSNHHVAINDHFIEVRGDPKNKRPMPSVDGLFSTAAEAYGDRLIAVILTGSGSDGAAGAVDVKNAGGTVIVQNPQTARYPSMPLALPPTVIDFEANVESIGPLLYDLLNGVTLPQHEERTEDVLRSILELVSRQASLDFRSYKTSTILRRIGRRMAVTHCRTMPEYLEYLKVYPEEVGELVKAFLINVTQFFRDPNAFAYLKSEILPTLIEQAHNRDHTLRFWTAGCATGEEPYSLAMLVTDLLGAELSEWNVKIFATDLDEAAVNFARRGIYSENLLKGMPTEYHDRFFERVDHGYRIAKTLRQMVIFGQQDLSRSAPFPRIDLLLCRNVLIYFTPELQDYVLNQFAFSLSSNGYLFLGKAETVRPNQVYYELVNKHWKIYRCTSNTLPATNNAKLSDGQLQQAMRRIDHHPGRTNGKQLIEQESPSPSHDLGQLQRLNELLLRFLPVGVVVIDRSYHVLTANGTARRFLGLRDITNEQDFLHAVRGIPYTEVRNAIDAVFRERNTITLPEVELGTSIGGNGRFMCLSIALLQIDAGSLDLAAISVSDVTEQVQVRRQLETVQAEQVHLMNELSTSNKRLNDMNKELMDSNEELQVANEELMLTHEELQASIEEFETTNEELQATNEELETNNEELQATNEELETTNEELRATTGELQELTSILESEHVRLAEMVELAPFYTMVLRGPNLRVEAFNPRYARILEGLIVQNRPLEEVFEFFWDSGGPIVRLAHEAYQKDTVCTTRRVLTYLPQAHGEPLERYFAYSIIPTHDSNRKVSGVIIYAMDETIELAKEIEEERERLRLIFDNMNMAALALYDAQTQELIIGSPHYLDLKAQARRLDRNHLVGRRWHELTFVASDEQAMALWNKALESHATVRLPEVRYKFPSDEQDRVFDWSLTPIMDVEKTDTVRFMLVSMIEITEQVQARQEVEQMNRLKDDFLSLACHELRTPLSIIKGNAELILRSHKRQLGASRSGTPPQTLDSEQETLMLGRIISQANRMNKLVAEMLDVTRITAQVLELRNRENVNIVELARRVVERYASAANRAIKLEASQDTITGNWDEDRLEQVMDNLLSNAIKYSSPDRPVTIGIERRLEPKPEVIVWVRDEGIGISEEQQTHIFDRFYRGPESEHSRIEGLGLGLYIAREIIIRQGGQMWLESKPGEGSTFYFSLPL